jgi:hypothetical protein
MSDMAIYRHLTSGGQVQSLRENGMSYNVAVCTAPVPEDDEAAWAKLDDFINAKGPIPEVFKSLHDRLTSRYPCICSLPEKDVDEGVWSDGPLWNNFGHRAAVLGMVFSRVEEALPFLVDTANELGLTVFDWGGPSIYRPDNE